MGQSRVLVFTEVVMSGKPIIRSISGLCRKGEERWKIGKSHSDFCGSNLMNSSIATAFRC